MVPKTSDDLPDPETPVNTVSRRLGIARLTSFRLFTRAPWTRIESWPSAGRGLDEGMARSCHRAATVGDGKRCYSSVMLSGTLAGENSTSVDSRRKHPAPVDHHAPGPRFRVRGGKKTCTQQRDVLAEVHHLVHPLLRFMLAPECVHLWRHAQQERRN